MDRRIEKLASVMVAYSLKSKSGRYIFPESCVGGTGLVRNKCELELQALIVPIFS
jgi:hypothetical protein